MNTVEGLARQFASERWERLYRTDLFGCSQATINQEVAEARVEVLKWYALLKPIYEAENN